MAIKKSFAGSIVLGLNDSLIEITGVLVGLTLAFQDSRVVLVAGLVTGIAASLSMAASAYLQAKQEFKEGSSKHPVTSSIYTGVAYVLTTLCLIAPFTILSNHFFALIGTIVIAIIIIGGYSFYVSTLREESFFKNFLEMIYISSFVGIISFFLGIGLQRWLGV